MADPVAEVETRLASLDPADAEAEAIDALETAVAGRQWDTAAYLVDYLRNTSEKDKLGGAAADRSRLSAASDRGPRYAVRKYDDAAYRRLPADDPGLAAEIAEHYGDPIAYPPETAGRGYVHLVLMAASAPGAEGPARVFMGHAGRAAVPGPHVPFGLARAAPAGCAPEISSADGGCVWVDDVYARPGAQVDDVRRRLLAAAAGADVAALVARADDRGSGVLAAGRRAGFAEVRRDAGWVLAVRPAGVADGGAGSEAADDASSEAAYGGASSEAADNAGSEAADGIAALIVSVGNCVVYTGGSDISTMKRA